MRMTTTTTTTTKTSGELWPVDDETANRVASLSREYIALHQYDPYDLYCGSPCTPNGCPENHPRGKVAVELSFECDSVEEAEDLAVNLDLVDLAQGYLAAVEIADLAVAVVEDPESRDAFAALVAAVQQRQALVRSDADDTEHPIP